MKGLSLGLKVVVIMLVILIVALVVLTIFGGGIGGISNIIAGWQTSASCQNLCAQKCYGKPPGTPMPLDDPKCVEIGFECTCGGFVGTQACIAQGGVCKANCGSGESEIAGATGCPTTTPKCCKSA